MKLGCTCMSCRLEENILPMLAGEDGLQREAIVEAMPAMTRILGVMLATLEPCELEPTWRLMLDARCRALDFEADIVGAAQGRC